MPRLSDDARDERRTRILDGARRCFARYGYEGATVVRLEREIGLSRGAIFNWFASKEALFFELAVVDNERLLDAYASDGFAALVERLASEDADWLAVYLEFARRLRNDPSFRARWERRGSDELRERARERLESGQRAGSVRRDVTAEEAGRFLGLLADGLLTQRALGFEPPPTTLIVRLAEDALRAPGGPPDGTI